MRVCQFRHFGTVFRRRSRWTAATASVTKASTRVKPPPACTARRALHSRKSFFMPAPVQPKSIPELQAKEIASLSHDLSNALESVCQTSFLLGPVDLDE